MNFNKQVALVTGAGAGIGLATARAFAEAGATVALASMQTPFAPPQKTWSSLVIRRLPSAATSPTRLR